MCRKITSITWSKTIDFPVLCVPEKGTPINKGCGTVRARKHCVLTISAKQ